MLFNSLDFLVFLPIVFLLYWFVFQPLRWKNLLIVVASYVFYGWWDWRFLLLIALTSVCSYASGLMIECSDGKRKVQKMVSTSNIVLNLAILGIFKYYNFFMENLDALTSLFGYKLDRITLDIILPVGISFYTFQALSYTIDVYCGRIRATHNIVEFLAYISFFPQLVAGPIERATNLLPQFQRDRKFCYDQAVDGCRQMLWGFFKKLVIADNCAPAVDQIWASYADQTSFVLLLGGILFTFQIYCDFSGYSDIAIGCARLFGINLMRNFNTPYFSRSVSEFYRKWHISLITWLRDYIYFPLGGSRCVKWKVVRNIIIVWAISGLWHGANWTFICWGLFNGTIISIYYLLGINTKYKEVVGFGHYLPNIKELGQMALTFFFIFIGRIIFRSENLSQAIDYLISICDKSILDIPKSLSQMTGMHLRISIPAICLMLLIEWIQRDKQHALQFSSNNIFTHYAPIRYAFYIVFVTMIIYLAGTQAEFIYFQF